MTASTRHVSKIMKIKLHCACCMPYETMLQQARPIYATGGSVFVALVINNTGEAHQQTYSESTLCSRPVSVCAM